MSSLGQIIVHARVKTRDGSTGVILMDREYHIFSWHVDNPSPANYKVVARVGNGHELRGWIETLAEIHIALGDSYLSVAKGTKLRVDSVEDRYWIVQQGEVTFPVAFHEGSLTSFTWLDSEGVLR